MGLYFEKQYFFCRTLNKKREPIDSIRAFLIMNSKLCINLKSLQIQFITINHCHPFTHFLLDNAKMVLLFERDK